MSTVAQSPLADRAFGADPVRCAGFGTMMTIITITTPMRGASG